MPSAIAAAPPTTLRSTAARPASLFFVELAAAAEVVVELRPVVIDPDPVALAVPLLLELVEVVHVVHGM